MNEMNEKYLSDDELMMLISECEAEGLTEAPADMLTDVLTAVERNNHIVDFEKKRREYRRFCIQVASSVAAAVILLGGILIGGRNVNRPIPDKASVVGEVSTPKVEALIESHKIIDYYESFGK